MFLLESGGPPSDDTVVVAPAGKRRVIMLRRGAPDNSLFATITLSDSATAGGSGDSVKVIVRPRPGIYGLDLTIEGPLTGGAELAISYAVHFVAPAGARERYGSDLDFERALFIARVMPDSQVVFLPTGRPGSDLVSAVVPGSGRYVVAAPRP